MLIGHGVEVPNSAGLFGGLEAACNEGVLYRGADRAPAGCRSRRADGDALAQAARGAERVPGQAGPLRAARRRRDRVRVPGRRWLRRPARARRRGGRRRRPRWLGIGGRRRGELRRRGRRSTAASTPRRRPRAAPRSAERGSEAMSRPAAPPDGPLAGAVGGCLVLEGDRWRCRCGCDLGPRSANFKDRAVTRVVDPRRARPPDPAASGARAPRALLCGLRDAARVRARAIRSAIAQNDHAHDIVSTGLMTRPLAAASAAWLI